MRKTVYTVILFCTFNFAHSQEAQKVYFSRGHNHSTVYSYFIEEIILFSDSTFTRYSYSVPNKKEWKNYKKYVPIKFEGRISKHTKFYVLTEIRDGEKSDIIEYFKINNQRLLFYLKNTDGTFEKVHSMKRKK